MKKILLILSFGLISLGGFCQAGAATASLQNIANTKLNAIDLKLGGTLTFSPVVSALTITSSSVTSSGTVTSGQRSVSFTTSSDFVGTINGVSRVSSTVYVFSCGASNTLPAIAYVITTGSIIIDKL